MGWEEPLSTFELMAAIDIRAGRVVRLVQGDFGRETVYGDDPSETARALASTGVAWKRTRSVARSYTLTSHPISSPLRRARQSARALSLPPDHISA